MTLVAACAKEPAYEAVYKYPISEWSERASKLPDKDFLEAYEYGVVSNNPPVVLSDAAAKRGSGFIIKMHDEVLKSNNSYLIYSLVEVAEELESESPGAFCSDGVLRTLLSTSDAKIDNRVLLKSYRDRLHRICRE
jgi:hypothetical protein